MRGHFSYDPSRHQDFPEDPSGSFTQFKDFIRSNFQFCKWIGLSIVFVQVSLCPPSLCTCVNLWVKIIYLVILAINLSGICRISGKVIKYFNVAITGYLKVVGLINSKCHIIILYGTPCTQNYARTSGEYLFV